MRCNNCGWANPDGLERCQKCNQELDYSLAALESVESEAIEPEVLAIVEKEPENTPAPAVEEAEAPAENNQISGCPQCGYPVAGNATECPMCGCAIANTPAATPSPQEAPNKDSEQAINSTKATIAMGAVLETIEQEAALKIAETKKTTVLPEELKSDNVEVKSEVKPQPVVEEAPKKAQLMKQTVRDFSPSDFLEEQQKESVKDTVREVAAQEIQKQEQSKGFVLTPVDGFGDAHSKLQFEEESVVLNRANVDKDNVAIDEAAQLSVSLENGEWYIENRSSLKNTYIVPTRKVKVESGDIVVIGNRRYIFEK